MGKKRFEYQHKDKPALKKDIAFRLMFAVLFLGVFVWQIIDLVLVKKNGNATALNIVIGAIVLFFALMFILVAILYAIHDINTLRQINKNGKSIRVVTVFNVKSKTSIVKLYSAVTKIIAIVMLLLFCSACTYSVLQFVHYSTIPYYLPALLLLCLSGFNAVFHINAQIDLMKNVYEYHSVY